MHAFAIMNNHAHQILSYQKTLHMLSHFMRVAHGIFGSRFNRMTGRTGKVANERPKTSLIQNDFHAMRAQFYVEANPIRANICRAENLKLYAFSSYRFYAFGIVDEFTKMLTPPSWYMALGATSLERQAKYRSLFMAYLRRSSENPNESKEMHSNFIGEVSWLKEKATQLRRFMQLLGAPPPQHEKSVIALFPIQP